MWYTTATDVRALLEFSSAPSWFGDGRDPFARHQCEYQDCHLTPYSSTVNISSFDAVLFHLENMDSSSALFGLLSRRRARFDRARRDNQRFVAFVLESPLMMQFADRFDEFNDFFNWTMTYRRDSDIYAPYGTVNPLQSPPREKG